MPRPSVTLAEHPMDMVRLACTKCERRGQVPQSHADWTLRPWSTCGLHTRGWLPEDRRQTDRGPVWRLLSRPHRAM